MPTEIKKKIVVWIIIACAAALTAGFIYVQKLPETNTQDFSKGAVDPALSSFSEISRGDVLEVLSSEVEQSEYFSGITQVLKVRITSGNEKNKEVTVEYDDQLVDVGLQEVKVGDQIVMGKISDPESSSYVLIDRYRLPSLVWIFVIFVALAVFFGRKRGLTSILGLAFSIFVLLYFIAPSILAGKSPVLVTMVGGGIIVLVSMFLAHGFRQRTCLAVISMLITLGLAEGLAYGVLSTGNFFGMGSDEAFYLQQGFFNSLNLQGLLLAGIIISALGVLDDITAAQAATVEEIYLTNPALKFNELFSKAASVGREHIASLINTLVLAYAGASLPLFLLLTLGSGQPLWAILNSEALAEEIARTLVGSIALILAVPITTGLVAYYFTATETTELQR